MKHRTLWVAVGVQRAQPQHTAEEATCLTRWAAGRRRLVEIGVAEGASALVIRRAMHPTGDLWLIDPFHLSRNPLFNTGLVAAKRTVNRCRRGRVHFIIETSQDAAREWSQPIDFVFVDGDHRREAVLADWQGFSQWIEVGGVVLLHDAVRRPGHPNGPADVIDELFRRRPLKGWQTVDLSGSIVAVQRMQQK